TDAPDGASITTFEISWMGTRRSRSFINATKRRRTPWRMPPPHGLSRGKTFLSRRTVATPILASVKPAIEPARPPPTMRTSASYVEIREVTSETYRVESSKGQEVPGRTGTGAGGLSTGGGPRSGPAVLAGVPFPRSLESRADGDRGVVRSL